MERIQVLHGSDGKWHLYDRQAGAACACDPFSSKAEAEAAKAEFDDAEPFANGPDTAF